MYSDNVASMVVSGKEISSFAWFATNETHASCGPVVILPEAIAADIKPTTDCEAIKSKVLAPGCIETWSLNAAAGVTRQLLMGMPSSAVLEYSTL
jgi:hypothetical protein